MSQAPGATLNRAKPYQLMLFPLNNGATNVYFVLILGSAVMAVSVICLYVLTPFISESMMVMRYIAFTVIYFVWVIGYTFQTSCTRAGRTVLTGAKMKTIQAVNAARKEAGAGGMSLKQAIETVTDESVRVSK